MITIDLRDKRPLYLQVIEGIEDLTIKGVLKTDEQLPSVRSLAMELSINPNTIQRAYLDLEKRGITYSMQGKGSFISKDKQALTAAKIKDLFKSLSSLTAEAKSLGIKEEELVKKIAVFYGNGNESVDE